MEMMASNMLEDFANATASYPEGHVLHGIVPGVAEADIRGLHAHYFSVNVWNVRGLLELHSLFEDFPILIHNGTLAPLLVPTANEWRACIRFAANFTAVRNSDGDGLYFLHP